MKKNVLIILGVSFGNFWIYQLLSNSILLGLLILLESVLLFLSALPENSKKIQVALFTLLAGISIFLLATSFNKEIFYVSDYEKMVFKARESYFGRELGKIYGNRAGIFYFDQVRPVAGKVSTNFASNLDLGKYFLTKNIGEGRYPLILLPVFVFGILNLVTNFRKTPTLYFLLALTISSLVGIDGRIGPVLLFPFFNVAIALGVLSLSPFAENRERKLADGCEEISASEGFCSRRSSGEKIP